jgi:hypothetical protein
MGLILSHSESTGGLVEPHFSPQLNAREYHLGKEFAAAHDGLLPSDNFWSYLRARHELNPTRFDHYHPHIAGMLDRDEYVRSHESQPILPVALGHPTVAIVPPPVVIPPPLKPSVPPPGGGSSGGGPGISSVPEPSTLVLLATALIAVALFHLFTRAKTFGSRRPRPA